ncbi:MAG TPA: hypothetical protein ENI23_05465 [bacterium]|nr:hypothetical protein [bacterium]
MIDLPTPQKQELERIAKEDRPEFFYDDQNNFSESVLIRGTNKRFTQHETLFSLDRPSKSKLDWLISETKKIDTSLEIANFINISELKLVCITEEHLIFKSSIYPEERYKYFAIGIPNGNKSLPFDRFSSFLGIPANFSKKNPGFLNIQTFEYYQKITTLVSGKNLPVDLVYIKDPVDVMVDKAVAHGDHDFIQALEGSKIQAHQVINIFKRPGARGRKKEEDPPGEIRAISIAEKVPLFSQILSNTVEALHSSDELNPGLQSFSVGYDVGGRGYHFARLVFDNPEYEIHVPSESGGDTFQIGLNITSDFMGTSSGFGQVNFSFIMFKEICSNGMIMTLPNEQRENLRERFVAQKLEDMGELDKEAPETILLIQKLNAQFHQMFSADGIHVPVALANSSLETSQFSAILKFFLDSKEALTEQFTELQQTFGEVDQDKFVESLLTISNNVKLASKEIVKYMILEYVAGVVSRSQRFKSPMDLINYLTFMARAYPANTMVDIERKAMLIGQAMLMEFITKTQTKKVSAFAQYSAQINPALT